MSATIIFERHTTGECPHCDRDAIPLYVNKEHDIVTCGDCTLIFEQLDKGECRLCKIENWLYFTPSLRLTACGACTTRLAHTRVLDNAPVHKTKTQRQVEKLYGTG